MRSIRMEAADKAAVEFAHFGRTLARRGGWLVLRVGSGR